MMLHRVDIGVCDPCLDGIPDECHTPGCAFFAGEAPTVEVGERLRSWAQETRIKDMEQCSAVTIQHDRAYRCRRIARHDLDHVSDPLDQRPGEEFVYIVWREEG